MPHWVLLIDDDRDNRELLTELLEYSGYAVESCGTAAGAHSILDARGKPSLVLADVLLPDLSGPDFVTAMKERPGFEAIPVVFVSGFQAAALGPTEAPVLTKPLDFDVLMTLVARHCDARTDALV
jgi:CheY-like chemotaxis protein